VEIQPLSGKQGMEVFMLHLIRAWFAIVARRGMWAHRPCRENPLPAACL